MGVFDDANDAIYASELGGDATYRPASGPDRAIRVVRTLPDQDFGVEQNRLRASEGRFEMRASDGEPVRGERLIVLGVSWTIKDISVPDPERLLRTLDCVRS